MDEVLRHTVCGLLPLSGEIEYEYVWSVVTAMQVTGGDYDTHKDLTLRLLMPLPVHAATRRFFSPVGLKVVKNQNVNAMTKVSLVMTIVLILPVGAGYS